MKYILFIACFWATSVLAQAPSAMEIIKKVDSNMFTSTKISESSMVIYGKRRDRTITSLSYSRGEDESYSEYLSPAREKGTKMLKLKDRLWIYSPSTDRIIQISGHMLRQSLMGSDVSYEDMMQERKLAEAYESKIIKEEEIDGRKSWLIELLAKYDDLTYQKMHLWVDQAYFVPLKEDLYAKSGQLLKTIAFSDIQQVGNKYFPMKMNYKDALKEGKGTDFITNKLQYDVPIPEHVFNKGNLKK